MRFSTLAVAACASAALAAPAAPTATQSDPVDVHAAQATALTESPTSKVKGKAFDRYVSIVCSSTLHRRLRSEGFDLELSVSPKGDELTLIYHVVV
jgi:hypothetical protein